MINLKSEIILITGANGFLGNHLKYLLKSKNIKFHISESKKNDLTNFQEAKKLFKKINPTVVFSLAAKVGGILANKENKADFYRDNTLINTNIYELCRIYKIKKLINVGAGCGYPLELKEPLREEDIWNGFPQAESAAYSLSKKMLIMQSIAYKEQYNLNSITLIPSNIYGEYDNYNLIESHVVPALVRKFFEAIRFDKKEIYVWGDKNIKRDFIYGLDVAKALYYGAKYYSGTLPLNICFGKQFSIHELVLNLKKISDFKGKIIWDKSKPTGQKSREMSQLNQKKFLNKWKPQIKFYEGLDKTYNWFEENYDNKNLRL
jgi:GDP-L-fucose synthase